VNLAGVIALLLPALAGYVTLSRLPAMRALSCWELFPLGTGLGLGITSCGFLIWLMLGGTAGRGYAAGEGGALLIVIFVMSLIRLKPTCLREGASRLNGWMLLTLVVAVAAGISIVLISLTAPQGSWDGWAIWNLRARFLYRGGEFWRDGFTNSIGWSHPDYPLLLPGTIARVWCYAGYEAPASSAMVAATFAMCVTVLLGGAVARLKGAGPGLLAAMVCAGSEYFVRHSAGQYADVPLSFFLLAGVVMICQRDPSQSQLVLAGIAAGLAAWTKNEGAIFCVMFLVASLIQPRQGYSRAREAGLIILGMAPILALVVVFKLSLAPANDLASAFTLRDGLAMLADPGRWLTVVAFFARSLVRFSGSVLPLLMICWLLQGRAGWDRCRRESGRCFGLIFLMLACYVLIYVVTPQNLEFHLETSCRRLILQLFPITILGFFLGARPQSRELGGDSTLSSRSAS
jgi:hypothetical protein